MRAFTAAEARFLVVSAYALALHGGPRDWRSGVWIDATPKNAERVMRALADFGAPLFEVAIEDFAREGIVYQIGVPPGRIDILTALTRLTLAEVWPGRVSRPFVEIEVDSSAGTPSCATSGLRGAPRISATSKNSNRFPAACNLSGA